MKYFLSAFFVFVLVFVLGMFIFNITLEDFDCKNQYGECSLPVLEKIGEVKGKNIFFVKKEVAKRLDNNISVKAYKISYKIPSYILVNLVERKPIFAIGVKSDRKFVLVDEEGYALSVAERTNLPKVYTDNEFVNLGQVVDEKFLFSLKIISDVNYLYQVNEGELKEDKLEILLPGKILTIFPLLGDRKVLVGSLNLILSQLNDENNEFKIDTKENNLIIDLRFKNPVIR